MGCEHIAVKFGLRLISLCSPLSRTADGEGNSKKLDIFMVKGAKAKPRRYLSARDRPYEGGNSGWELLVGLLRLFFFLHMHKNTMESKTKRSQRDGAMITL